VRTYSFDQNLKPFHWRFNIKGHVFDFRILLLYTSETLQDLLNALLRRFRVLRRLTDSKAEVEQLGGILGVERNNVFACRREKVRAISQLEFRDRFHSGFKRTSTTRTTLTLRRGFAVDCCSEKAGLLEFIRLQSF
jgi:hypothetical protein